MSYLAFEHSINLKSRIKRSAYSIAVDGEIVHCEFHFPNHNLSIASSWNPEGVQIRAFGEFLKQADNWIIYNLGNNYDDELLKYFESRIGHKYSKKSLFLNMFLSLNISTGEQNFCSQVCYEALTNVLKMDLPKIDSNSVSPTDLHRMISMKNIPIIKYQ